MTFSATRSSSEAIAGARPSRLMQRIYRDVGLAAVAHELELSMDDLEPELSEAVRRGARFMFLMPKSKRNPTAPSSGASGEFPELEPAAAPRD